MNSSSLFKVAAVRVRENKYLPHSGVREQKRRLRQIAAGTLQGEYITTAARYTAIGLADPA